MIYFSRREILKFASTAMAVSVAVPIAKLINGLHFATPLTKAPTLEKNKGMEVHFHGKHEFAALLARASSENWRSLPIGELMGRVATSLLDTPYVNYTLDHSADHEYCIVNLQELDCVTFVEVVLAFARAIKLDMGTEDEMASQVALVRYRDGNCSGFCARLHYLSDWLYDNEQKGLINVYTKTLPGAKNYVKKVSLMSDRPQNYLQLRAHPEFVATIRADENAINMRTEYFVPKDKVKAAEGFMQTGDIVAITTVAKILDCAHTGLCYRDEKGVLRFLHASLTHHKVYLDSELCDYLDTVRAFTGIMLARPREPLA